MILQENIEIFGKKIRVNNDNFSPIAELWGDVMVDKPAGDIFVVYSNYASDYKGDYDLLVGTKDWDEEKSVLIKAGDYLVFSVDNASHKGVEETWQKIWARDSELKRAYKTDFEWYHTSGEIDIYISI
ncbi:TPA: effector binding domain-containing protein [Listeria monocytogenes]|uniref:GyrI-like domain-containing protein n=1 Tax=Listeria monocytogenes TaxID=1639 RepID=UPI000397EC1C|nr:effector binding domain-containing protein [Listeria monocytogenes]EAG9190645.1 AraC family transcriptional regulator [Listeria monocytogenes]ERH80357.1 transcriptional activator [Listeria monocytogenes serotype 4bV str. LS645]ERH82127.1 transcriptional activator [Listeria monocytogenes serotype 4bV str. LS644]ERH83541.1 transcriptional activator [Listeria monocytogenes serotype 4bV str. LS643]PWD46927.1 AraC family transcriptional regulator [Listeria monocytogenes]